MDLNNIASGFVVLVVPLLPYLVSGLQEAGNLLGGAAFTRVQKSWNEITTRSKGDKKFQRTVEILAEQPDDVNFRAALSSIVLSHLAKNPALLSEISSLLQENSVQEILITDSHTKNINQTMSTKGKQSITVGNSQTGNISQDQ